ncbi:MAG: YitT family protein [Lactobacillaceae bacterium]|jgi:uncharacterized membrane-anchored protein YitT (DUF2179 family)|nr:YitT family protein [Lactobacillaceae bacterium]
MNIRIHEYLDKHQIFRRFGASILYGLIFSIAMNFFWKPGDIYSSGFTGLAQILNALFHTNNIALMILLVNVPMSLLAWKFIGNRFAFFEVLAIIVSSIFVTIIKAPSVPLANDPMIDAIFGGVLNGLAVGIALRNGVATGGVDIAGILFKKYFNIRIMPINLTFNGFIMIGSVAINGWKYAFYSILGIVISSWIQQSLYARQQLMQVLIVTNKKQEVIKSIQKNLRRGITILNDAQGAYLGDKKDILLTVITNEEMYIMQMAVKQADENAFASIWKVDRTFGKFYEKEY